MKTRKCFTLVELLVVAGIIALLAGLILPAVIGGAQQGRITQAKSDMNSIQMALAQMDQTYHRILKKDGSDVKFLSVVTSPQTNSDGTLGTTVFSIVGMKGNGHKGATSSSFTLDTAEENGYDALIAELTATGGSGSYSQNTRKIRFLEPNKNYDPSKAYTDNKPYLWRDPWGNPYTIMINIDGTDRLVKPDAPSTGKFIMAKTAVYSRGPNGEDDLGRNISQGGDGVKKTDDDIATWHK